MKNTIKFLAAFTLLTVGVAQGQVGVGTTTPDASAALDVSSTTKGLLLPRLTATERDAITSPATGLMIFNTTANGLQFNSGTPAIPVWSSAGAGIQYQNVVGEVEIRTSQTTYVVPTGKFFIITKAAGALTIQLPNATQNAGKVYAVVNNNTAAGNVTVQNHDGTPILLSGSVNQNRGRFFISDGTSWVAISPV